MKTRRSPCPRLEELQPHVPCCSTIATRRVLQRTVASFLVPGSLHHIDDTNKVNAHEQKGVSGLLWNLAIGAPGRAISGSYIYCFILKGLPGIISISAVPVSACDVPDLAFCFK